MSDYFKFDNREYQRKGKAFMGAKGPFRGDYDTRYRSNPDRLKSNPSLFYLAKHMKELDIMQFFEDDFECSGMCHTGLFYFHRTLENGSPKDTCLVSFYEKLAG